jgi:hypothetical protein
MFNSVQPWWYQCQCQYRYQYHYQYRRSNSSLLSYSIVRQWFLGNGRQWVVFWREPHITTPFENASLPGLLLLVQVIVARNLAPDISSRSATSPITAADSFPAWSRIHFAHSYLWMSIPIQFVTQPFSSQSWCDFGHLKDRLLARGAMTNWGDEIITDESFSKIADLRKWHRAKLDTVTAGKTAILSF